jgi:hypothetical protein
MSSRISNVSGSGRSNKNHSSSSPSKSPVHNPVKKVEIYDEWEHFKIKFSINDSIED